MSESDHPLRLRLILMLTAGVLLAMAPMGVHAATAVFVNELHYDNAGVDVNEFVEVAGPAGTDLTGWTVALYDGKRGQRDVYDTIVLGGTIDDEGSGYGALAFPATFIDNGGPDGLALIGPGGEVVQFLSYEGSFFADTGPAAGLQSVDIGIQESNDTQSHESLQLTGVGSTYEDFTWTGPTDASPGSLNAGQTFPEPEPEPDPAPTTCQGLPITILGTPGDDVLVGTNGDDVIHGWGGNDEIDGGNGKDVICGGDGDDTIDGGNGKDDLDGGDGDDTIDGGNGKDDLDGGDGDDTLDGGRGKDTGDGGAGTDTCTDVETAASCEA